MRDGPAGWLYSFGDLSFRVRFLANTCIARTLDSAQICFDLLSLLAPTFIGLITSVSCRVEVCLKCKSQCLRLYLDCSAINPTYRNSLKNTILITLLL